ncbi:unnamed protein product [Oncorhynchus mykiss]|uniref:Transposase Helix-turn-helix domain-containing protein n=1 Tax=Oncorhynchus mykiss TaxID=8022 RepID=A0A060YSI9_ONCMY|nr:unnamed protein product [Oncorhynchus mykiss]
MNIVQCLCSVSSKCNGIVSFHSFLVDVELRKRWLVAVRRDNFTVTKHTKVCSTHCTLNVYCIYIRFQLTPQNFTRSSWAMIVMSFFSIQITPGPSTPGVTRRKPTLLSINEFFLFMTHLSLGLKQKDLTHRFSIHQSTVSRIIISWTNFLYCLLGSARIWIPKETIKAHLPPEFKDYPDTQVVMDCTELCCQTPSSLLLQSEMFSSYKSQYL